MKNLKNLPKKFCEFPPWMFKNVWNWKENNANFLFTGPDCLEVLDLSYIKIFPDNTTRKGSKQLSNPLANAKILNLTGSLTNNENPLDMLSLSSMPKLEVLEIGQVRFHN